MFVNMSRNDVGDLYSLYETGEYNIFFRHFEDFLNIDEFVQALDVFKWLTFPEGYLSLKISPKIKQCMISILVLKEKQKQGFGLESMKQISKYLFNNGIERIVVTTVETDEHTNLMCEKGGFEKEGVQIDSCKICGLFHNEIRYGISKDNYFALYGGANE